MNYYKIGLITLTILFYANSNLSAQKVPAKVVKSPISNAKQKLLDTDKDFCKMSLKSGIKEAFVSYADKNLVKMEQDKPTIFGLEALKLSLKDDKANPANLIWTPVKAEFPDP